MTEIYDYGTDIHNSWTFNDKGDLNLSENENNIAQAVMNRLTTNLDELPLYYAEYGSLLRNYMGEKKTEETLQFISIEVESRLILDPRINDIDVETSLTKKGVRLNLHIYYNENEELEMNIILDGETMEVIENGIG